jgi:cytochrome P450
MNTKLTKTLSILFSNRFLAYDVISEIGFGAPIGFIEAGEDRDRIVPNLHAGLRSKAIWNRVYPFLKFAKNTWLVRKYFESKPDDPSGLGILMRLRDRLLDRRLSDIKTGAAMERTDLLQTILDARTADGQPLPIPLIKAEILLVLLAGADTTGTVMQGLIHHCITRPEIYDKISQEIDEVTRKGLVSSPMPQFEEVSRHCPYYVACVWEVMRLCPSSPALFPRLVSGGAGMDFGDGRVAPPGTEVASTPWLIHRDKEMYGPDAEEFVPERWLGDADQVKRLHKYFFGFGYGSRVCLGKDIALTEIYKAPFQVSTRTWRQLNRVANGCCFGVATSSISHICHRKRPCRYIHHRWRCCLLEEHVRQTNGKMMDGS